MTCVSCAARIEKKPNKLDGVSAMVNVATERAAVSFPGAITLDELVAVVERAGYTATLPAPAPEPEVRVPVAQLAVGDLFVVRPGGEDRHRRGGRVGRVRGGRLDAHRRARAGGGHRGGRGQRRVRERLRPPGGPRRPGRRRRLRRFKPAGG